MSNMYFGAETLHEVAANDCGAAWTGGLGCSGQRLFVDLFLPINFGRPLLFHLGSLNSSRHDVHMRADVKQSITLESRRSNTSAFSSGISLEISL